MRGQTTLDFAVGAVIFIGLVGFVFFFVNSAVAPFTGNAQDDTVVANRVADELTGDLLGSPADPYVLDTYCTTEFFATLDGSPSAGPDECAYNGTDLNTRLGVTDRQNVNVSVLGNVTGQPTGNDKPVGLCWDEGTRTLINRSDAGCGSGDPELTHGPTPDDDQSTITARRTVSLAGRDVIFLVEVW